MSGREGTRRFPRLRARCRVELRDRFGTWSAETEDLGPRGCRVVTPRPQTVGTLVLLTVRSELVPAPLEVAGQVVWASSERPARAGISFAGSASTPGAVAPGAWFEALAGAARDAGVAGGRLPTPLPGALVPPPPPDLAGLAPAAGSLPRAPVRDPLVARLCERARELVAGGRSDQAEMLLRRALSLAPGDAEAAAALAAMRR